MGGLILSAIFLGALLNIISIGPAFFMLMEVSFLKGISSALILNLGILLSDVVCIIFSYYGSGEMIKYVDQNPFFCQLGGLVLFSYGFFMSVSKKKPQNKLIISSSFENFKLFIKGFLLNLTNPGVITLWMFVVLMSSTIHIEAYQLGLYFAIVLFIYSFIDLFKILLARKIYHKMTNSKSLYFLRKSIGIILILFGMSFFLGSFYFKEKKIKEKILLNVLCPK